jgi:hypothetical protein
MKNTTFDDFVRNQQVPPQETVDWKKERDRWLQNLADLHATLRGFLQEYINSGQIQFESHPVTLTEENIGTYTAPEVRLKIGRKVVTLTPIGTLLIGSKGRVDVVGPAGTRVPILMVNSKAKKASDMIRVFVGIGDNPPVVPKDEAGEIKWEWKMITRPPERRFVELSQETFFDMIMEVSNG